MAQPALPVTTAPRTVTIRVRTLVVASIVVASVAAVWWTLAWASGMQPLATGSFSARPFGLPIAARMPDALGPGPTAFQWRRGGTYDVTFQIHNSASVPVTITGVDHTFRDWVGAISGPSLENGDDRTLEPVKGRFRSVRIAADGTGVLTLVFHANPRAVCGAGTSSSIGAVTVHFVTLGIFHNSQTIPLGDMSAVMAAPPAGC